MGSAVLEGVFFVSLLDLEEDDLVSLAEESVKEA